VAGFLRVHAEEEVNPPEIRNQLPVDLDEQTVHLNVTIHGVDAVADLQPESNSL
jgi:hypothetical protein